MLISAFPKVFYFFVMRCDKFHVQSHSPHHINTDTPFAFLHLRKRRNQDQLRLYDYFIFQETTTISLFLFFCS